MEKLSEDRALVLRAQAGDAEAFEALLARWDRFIRWLSQGYFLDGADADDLISEGRFGFWKAVRDFNPDAGASFKTFVRLCVERQMVTAVKTAGRGKHKPLTMALRVARNEEGDEVPILDVVSGSMSTDPLDLLIEHENVQRLRQAAETLSELELIGIKAAQIRGGYGEAVEVAGRTFKGIDNAVQRGRKKIRRELERLEDEHAPEWAEKLAARPALRTPRGRGHVLKVLPQAERCQALVDLGPKWTGVSQCSFRRKEGRFCGRHVSRRVGEVGVPVLREVRTLPRRNAYRRYSRGEVIAAIWLWAAERGMPPSADEWRRGGDHPNTDTVVRVFGSWANGVEAAGFERPRRGVKRHDLYALPRAA